MKYLYTTLIMLAFGCCGAQDNIILKNGNEISGKVIKVGTSEVEYKKDSISPVYAIKKSDVFMIKYEGGRKDVLATISDVPKSGLSTEQLKIKYTRNKRAAIACFVIGGACLVAGSTTAGLVNANAPVIWAPLMGASIPFLIAGGVSVRRYAKYKRQWKRAQQPQLSFTGNGVLLNF